MYIIKRKLIRRFDFLFREDNISHSSNKRRSIDDKTSNTLSFKLAIIAQEAFYRIKMIVANIYKELKFGMKISLFLYEKKAIAERCEIFKK
ncbi:hypothetical protein RCL_jg23692.t1 [Rhizophagus clarus]|uniref:Uncharacterized protein n=1 Tax=Rhizophagus clarus TaxID=94130 RepID=A0A8H3L1D3_9GLOM|nr:hypothetical protein RCL_jg23692.t1 [Rhizophagus clarus]